MANPVHKLQCIVAHSLDLVSDDQTYVRRIKETNRRKDDGKDIGLVSSSDVGIVANVVLSNWLAFVCSSAINC